MGRTTLRITDKELLGDKEYFIEFSSIVDDFVTYGMTEDAFELYYIIEYGLSNFNTNGFKYIMEQLRSTGTASPFSSRNWIDCLNLRNEIYPDKFLTKEEFIKEFVLDKQEGNKQWYEKYKIVLDLIEKK